MYELDWAVSFEVSRWGWSTSQEAKCSSNYGIRESHSFHQGKTIFDLKKLIIGTFQNSIRFSYFGDHFHRNNVPKRLCLFNFKDKGTFLCNIFRLGIPKLYIRTFFLCFLPLFNCLSLKTAKPTFLQYSTPSTRNHIGKNAKTSNATFKVKQFWRNTTNLQK